MDISRSKNGLAFDRLKKKSFSPVPVEVEAVIGRQGPGVAARGGPMRPCLAGMLLMRVVGW